MLAKFKFTKYFFGILQSFSSLDIFKNLNYSGLGGNSHRIYLFNIELQKHSRELCMGSELRPVM